METVLWAINLVAVVYLCYWGWMQDGGRGGNKKKEK